MSTKKDVKDHFEEEAHEFDDIIRNLIPYYNQMMKAAVDALPFEGAAAIDVLDLGCGTGTLARTVKDAFPNACLTCVDIADNMLRMAHLKLADAPETVYVNCDFYDFNFDSKYDAVVSSLALHHLETPGDKLDFYKKIYGGLKPGGVFVNADAVLASTIGLQERYMDRWSNFMFRRIPAEEVKDKWIPKYYQEDRPVSLMDHIDMLKEAGFSIIEVIWKYYNFAVYAAVK